METRLDGGDSYRTAKFKGFNLVIHYARLVSNIWHHKTGLKHIYDPRITQTLAPAHEAINDFLIREISRTLVEHLDPSHDIFKCLILMEGLQVIVDDQNPFDKTPLHPPLIEGLKNFTSRSAREISENTGLVVSIQGGEAGG